MRGYGFPTHAICFCATKEMLKLQAQDKRLASSDLWKNLQARHEDHEESWELCVFSAASVPAFVFLRGRYEP
jgi:hypothetical protein